MIRATSAIVFSVFYLLLGSDEARAGERVALVVGNSAYEHTLKLPNPRNDAARMITILERLDFFVVGGLDLNRNKFEKAVRTFSKKLKTADVGLFFYAGHGLQVNGHNYLVPIDAKLTDEADLDFSMVELRKVMRQMEHNSKTNLVFIDACRDNPLARNLARAMGASRSIGIGRGMARTSAGVGTMITYATQPDNVALDGTGKNSPFTSALARHIETPGLDISHMLRRVRREVIKETKGHQVPWNHSSLTHGFVFKHDPGAVGSNANEKAQELASVAAGKAAQDRLLIAFQETRKLKDCSVYQAFEKKYADSFFARLARDWISSNCGKSSKSKSKGEDIGGIPSGKRKARHPFDGRWSGQQCLSRFRHLKAACYRRVVTIQNGRLRAQWGAKNRARSGTMRGTVKRNGRFVLSIKGRSATGRSFAGTLRGKISKNRLQGSGKYRTGRKARLKLSR